MVATKLVDTVSAVAVKDNWLLDQREDAESTQI